MHACFPWQAIVALIFETIYLKMWTGFLKFSHIHSLISHTQGALASKALLTWVRKDKHTYSAYKQTYIHAYTRTHTFWKTISVNQVHTNSQPLVGCGHTP